MNLCARVKSLTTQRMQRRGLSRQRAKELLLADAVVGLNDAKTGRAVGEVEFRRRFRRRGRTFRHGHEAFLCREV
jgi:hypothetical protein